MEMVLQQDILIEGQVARLAGAVSGAAAGVRDALARAAAWELRVLRELLLREIRLQHRGTALGLVWAVVSPLALGAVYVGLFRGVLGVGGEDYPRVMLAG